MTQTPTPTTAYREGTGAAVIILIPAYEPDEKLTDLVRRGTEAGLGTFVVVDDGSGPACAPVFQQVEALGAHVCHHEKNRGKGAAIKTGMTYIRETFPQAAGAVTADADGQHAVEDIQALAAEVRRKGESLILGVRSFDTDTVPWHSRAGNRITAAIFRLLTGIQCPDTQTGLRGIPAALFPLALATEGERYDYEMNFLIGAARQKVPLTMVPIRTIYLDDNKSSHFRVVRDSVLIYKKPVTFLLVSLLSSGTDLAAFWLLLRCLFGGQDHYIMLATILARVLSGVVNFVLNKKVTFRSGGSWGVESVRYLILFVACMLLSGGLVSLLSRLPVPTVLLKIVVDVALFVVNYYVEKLWVFRKERQ